MSNENEKFWFISSSGLIQFQLTMEQAHKGHHQGHCDADIKEMTVSDKEVIAALSEIDPATLRDELREYGAWDDNELADHTANLERILWLACGQIQDEHFQDEY